MKLQIQSIHFDADKKLLEFIQKKLDKLDTFYDRILDSEVFLKLDNGEKKDNKAVHVKVNIPGNIIVAKELGGTFEEAIDKVLENLKMQIIKQKQRAASY